MSISEEFRSRWRILISRFVGLTMAENDARSVPAANPGAVDAHYCGEYRQIAQDAIAQVQTLLDEDPTPDNPQGFIFCPEIGCKGKISPAGVRSDCCEDLCHFRKMGSMGSRSRAPG